MKKILAIAVVACLALTLVACGGLDVTKLTMPTELALETGQTSKLEITYNGEAKAEDVAKALEKAAVVWTSSDEAVATVDASGTVTAVAAGEADVTAASKDGKTSLTCKVTVTEPVEPEVEEVEEADDDDAVKMAVDNTEGGDAIQMMADSGVVIPETVAVETLTWSSSDETVATVDQTGHVTPVGIGECVISATNAAGENVTGDVWTGEFRFVVCAFMEEGGDAVADTASEDGGDKTADKTTPTATKEPAQSTDKTNGSTATGGETGSGGNNNSSSTATGGETVSGGNNSNNNTPAPTPVPDTGNNGSSTPPSGGIIDGGLDNVIPGGGITDQDGGNAAPPEDAPMAPPPVF